MSPVTPSNRSSLRVGVRARAASRARVDSRARGAGPALFAATALFAIALSACGGPVPSGSGSASATAAASNPVATASSAIAPTASAPASPSVSPSPASVGDQACSLATVETVETLVGVPDLTSRAEPGGDATTGTCSFVAGDRVVASVSLGLSGADAAFAKYAGSSAPVTGVGDAAIWVNSMNSLFVRVGDRVIGIQLLPTIVPPDEIQTKSIVLGRSAADHLP